MTLSSNEHAPEEKDRRTGSPRPLEGTRKDNHFMIDTCVSAAE